MKEEQEDCKLKVYSKRDRRAPILIADFTHGEVKVDEDGLKFNCFKKDSSANNVGCDATRELVASNGRLNYVGSSSPSVLQYFVGVRNKTTGKMKLYDSVMFRMKPVLKKTVSCSQPTTSKSYREGVNELTQHFGSKVRKRALNTLQKCAVDVSSNQALTVDESLLHQSSDIYTTDETHKQIDYLPPLNRKALLTTDVFDINDIISPEEETALNQEAQQVMIATSDEFNKWLSSFCKFVSVRFKNVNPTKAKLLLYYNYLITFQQLKYTDIRKKDPAPNIPNPLKKNILEKFTLMSSNDRGRSSRSCPTQMKDKLVAYILVLALFIDEFRVNLEEIHVDLSNVGVPKLKTIAEVLGCTISKKQVEKEVVICAELKIPLNEITPKYARKSSSKKF